MQLRAEVKELHHERDLAQAELAKFRKRFGEEEETAADNDMVKHPLASVNRLPL